jgi:hypothetical protein
MQRASVIPAQAGTQGRATRGGMPWIPAFAGMTRVGADRAAARRPTTN